MIWFYCIQYAASKHGAMLDMRLCERCDNFLISSVLKIKNTSNFDGYPLSSSLSIQWLDIVDSDWIKKTNKPEDIRGAKNKKGVNIIPFKTILLFSLLFWQE